MTPNAPVYMMAREFAELTTQSIFLTGKAGTGKTTFLKKIKEESKKQMAVVAPTGVAAINAKGVTIHSFFQLPFTPFVPTPEGRRNLIGKIKMSGARRNVIKELELLIIDEISMVRADVLDEIDTVLRHFRYRQHEPFGGLQVIFIGDLYQLSPVVLNEEWEVLSPYYKSPFFFDSMVIQNSNLLYLEFDTIFRQSDSQFIKLLNEIRDNHLSTQSETLLKECYQPHFNLKDHKDYILLTTHNYKADSINSEELARIKKPEFIFNATINGDFPERIYPNSPELRLKEGAKVMFIANENNYPRRYYNGKIGIISKIDENKQIFVHCDDIEEDILVNPEVWSNIKYSVNKSNKQIEEHDLGSFQQYPLRPAWAITIHKSQGLTFDKVAIDAEDAFTSGQVYVALSRCRSLEGLILLSLISKKSLTVDNNIVNYSHNKLPEDELVKKLAIGKAAYNRQVVLSIFNFQTCVGEIHSIVDLITKEANSFNSLSFTFCKEVKDTIIYLEQVGSKFRKQLNSYFEIADDEMIKKRIAAASDYFDKEIDRIIRNLSRSPVSTDNYNLADEYNNSMRSLHDELSRKQFIIKGIKNDYSAAQYYKLKSSFKVPIFSVNAHALSNSNRINESKYPDLFKQLNSLRRHICNQNEISAFMVVSTNSLIEMATYLPRNQDDLKNISGFGKVKIEKYGDAFLTVINEYCQKNYLSSEFPKKEKKKKRTPAKPNKSNTISTHEKSYMLYKEGKTIPEIAAARGLAESTIEGHLLLYIASGKVALYDFVTPEEAKAVRQLLEAGESLSSIFNTLGGNLSFGQLRMIQASIKHD